MPARIDIDLLPQPDGSVCGPTCLHAIYRYYGDETPLKGVIDQVPRLEEGGTLAVNLACHALRRGYSARIYTYNLQVFDPTWFRSQPVDFRQKLRAQVQAKTKRKLAFATEAYLDFFDLGGEVRMEDLTGDLLARHLEQGEPVLTGLSATWLYREARETGYFPKPDDVRGLPSGHFVLLCGYDRPRRSVLVADPLMPNPVSKEHVYSVDESRLISAVLLGILTYDANLLVVKPPPAVA